MRYLIGFLLVFIIVNKVGAQADVNFSGTVVQAPCTLAPDDSKILIDFASVADAYLYTNTRTAPQLFRIHLQNCDLSIGTVASVTFTGTEDTEQKGLLALDPASTAKGVAIGIETLRHELIPINVASSNFTLKEGDTTLYLAAFAKASLSAIQNKTIVSGNFSSTATFELTYN